MKLQPNIVTNSTCLLHSGNELLRVASRPWKLNVYFGTGDFYHKNTWWIHLIGSCSQSCTFLFLSHHFDVGSCSHVPIRSGLLIHSPGAQVKRFWPCVRHFWLPWLASGYFLPGLFDWCQMVARLGCPTMSNTCDDFFWGKQSSAAINSEHILSRLLHLLSRRRGRC